MLMILYQKSEVFAASGLTSFGEGPIRLSSRHLPTAWTHQESVTSRFPYDWRENEKSRMRKATNALPFLILPQQAAARLKSEKSGTPSCHSAFATLLVSLVSNKDEF